jgi:hypothetical protein
MRKDLPWLKELAQRERARQKTLHGLAASNERDLKASPGRHCTWCPLLLKGCPVAKTNPYSQMTAEERLRFALWLQEAEKQNTKVLKDLMVEHGPIHYRDGNESKYLANFVPVEKKFYPYGDAVSIVDEWFTTHPQEPGPPRQADDFGPFFRDQSREAFRTCGEAGEHRGLAR